MMDIAALTSFLHGLPWIDLILALQWLFLAYFICLNTAYLVLNFISVFSIMGYMREHRADYLPRGLASYQPPVSILVPAYNEQGSIVSSIHSLLGMKYPDFEVVVINDGSTDNTLGEVIAEFGMVEFPEAYRRRIETMPVRRIYASSQYPRVRLIDKDNGGKADTLNAGINCARFPLFCSIDADCILQPDSLGRVVRPFLEDPTIVAVGGVVRVLNGCTVRNGLMERIELPTNYLARFQLVEYLRAFLFGRLGWAPLNALLIISGAFGVFKKERVIAIGGYRSKTVGEDMDLVVRLHRSLRKEKRPYRITFVPDPICWTEVPTDLRSLKSQRMRWQRGLAESLAPNVGALFDRRGGAVSWLALPFMFTFELLGPVIEVLGYAVLIPLWLLDLIPLQSFLVFLFLSLGLGVLLSTNALFLEELSFQMYPRLGQQIRLFGVAILENFGYRQINSVWRFMAVIGWLFSFRRKSRWGDITRDGSWQHESDLPGSDSPSCRAEPTVPEMHRSPVTNAK
jgi:cellulose synthase/poly-beta-1,6-N-acetylglucosamine synthase-like glycosyltransferase